MSYKKPTPQDLRKANQSEILRKVYFEGPITRLEVSQDLGISPATVTNIVNHLLAENILIESGLKRSEGGRPSTLLEINPAYGYIIGFEVGETAIQVELFDILFNHLGKQNYLLKGDRIDPQEMVDLLVEGIETIIRQANLAPDDILGIGIGFPGLVDPVNGVSVFTPNWGWHNISITNLLKERLSIPMYLDNGAKAMAIAEMLFGAGKGVNDLAVLLLGTGVGSGIISNRKLFRGCSNNAGEFGHTTLNPDGPVCRCGSKGCLEVYVGANGIIHRYEALIAQQMKPPENSQISKIRKILEEYQAGQTEARQTVQETLHYIGVGIANLINTYNPEMLLLGGWSGLMIGERFLPEILEIVEKYALKQSLSRTTIQLCQLGQGAVAMGAATLVLEHFFESAGHTEEIIIGGKALKQEPPAHRVVREFPTGSD